MTRFGVWMRRLRGMRIFVVRVIIGKGTLKTDTIILRWRSLSGLLIWMVTRGRVVAWWWIWIWVALSRWRIWVLRRSRWASRT